MCGIFALLYQNMDIFDVSLNNSFMLGKKRGPEFSTFTKINDTKKHFQNSSFLDHRQLILIQWKSKITAYGQKYAILICANC